LSSSARSVDGIRSSDQLRMGLIKAALCNHDVTGFSGSGEVTGQTPESPLSTIGHQAFQISLSLFPAGF
jgi:hypothetical protein